MPLSSPHPATRPRVVRLLPPVALLLLVSLLYGRSTRFSFVNWDDPLHVYRNPSLLRPHSLSWHERWFPRRLGYPMPLTLLSYRLESAIFLDAARPIRPEDGRGFHLLNIGLALLLALLSWTLARLLLPSRAVAFGCCALFLAHPLLVEPIAWVSGRKDLLAVVLSLGAILAWLRWLARPRLASALAFALLGLLALAAKPLAAFLVPFAAYLLVARRARPAAIDTPGQRWSGYLALGLLGAGALGLVVVARGWNTSVGGVRSDLGLAELLHRALWALGFHLRLAVAPTVLRPKYVVAPAGWGVYETAGALAIALVAGGLLWRRRVAAPIGAGLALFVCSYLPVSGIIPLRRYVADTYMTLPLLGLLIACGGLIVQPFWPRSRLLAVSGTAAGFALLAMLATITTLQLPIWRDSVPLWRHTLAFHPDHPKICRMLGHAHNERGEHERALLVYRRCSARMGLRPFAKNLALTHFMLGHDDQAERFFRWLAVHRPGELDTAAYIQEIARRRARKLSERRARD